jgi:hypothetical protein
MRILLLSSFFWLGTLLMNNLPDACFPTRRRRLCFLSVGNVFTDWQILEHFLFEGKQRNLLKQVFVMARNVSNDGCSSTVLLGKDLFLESNNMLIELLLRVEFLAFQRFVSSFFNFGRLSPIHAVFLRWFGLFL